MTTDLFKTVLWNDGEGLTHADLNAAGMRPVARLTDQMLEHLTGGPLATAVVDLDQWGQNDNDTDLTSLVYTLTGGEAVLWSDGAPGDQLRVTAGTIFQKVANADGEEPGFLPFTIRDGDLSFSIAAGNAFSPRIDIVQVKLELVDGDTDARDFKDAVTGALTSTSPSKTRRVQATVSVKAGVAAGTPDYPAPDAGYAVLGAVRVPANWVAIDGIACNVAGGTTKATIRQCSVPLRVEGIHTNAHEWDTFLATNWQRDNGNGYMETNGGAATDLDIWCPVPTGNKRIVGLTVIGQFVASASLTLESVEFLTGVGNLVVDSFDLTAALATVGGGLKRRTAHLGKIADASSDSNPSAANGPIGDPMWACGGKAGPAQRPIETWDETLSNGASRARLRVDAGNGSFITTVVWYLAG